MVLVAVVMAGNGLVVPALPTYGEKLSASSTLVGMLVTVFGVVRLAANFPAGVLYHRLGSRRLLVAGSALLLLGAAGAALAEHDLVLLLILRGVQGAGSGIFLTTVGVVVALRTEAGRRGRMLARYQTAVFFGAGVGPTIGGILANAWGLSAPFWAYAGAALLALVVAAMFIDGDPPGDELVETSHTGSSGVLRHPQYVANLAMSFSLGFVRTAALWQLVPLVAAHRFAMTLSLVGFAVTVTSIANLVMLPAAGRAIDSLGWRVPPLVAAAAQAAALVLVALGTSPTAFWTGITVLGLAGAFIGPALSTAMVETVPAPALGSATGLQRTVGDAGFVLGPIVIGALTDAGGLSEAGGMLLVAATVIISGAWWLLAVRHLPADPSSR
nr:MFS transporter [Dactylosporangium thailandense]